MTQDPKRELRVSVREPDILELMNDFPKLTRTEITDAVSTHGPLRHHVEAELRRLSGMKN